MSGCLDNVNCGDIRCCELLREPGRRNRVVSAIAGTLFTIGWWIIVDVQVLPTPLYSHRDFWTILLLSFKQLFIFPCYHLYFLPVAPNKK